MPPPRGLAISHFFAGGPPVPEKATDQGGAKPGQRDGGDDMVAEAGSVKVVALVAAATRWVSPAMAVVRSSETAMGRCARGRRAELK